MTRGDTTADGSRPPGRLRIVGRLVLAFLLGVLLTTAAAVGLVVSGTLGDGSPDADLAPEPTRQAPSADAGSGDVPAPCLRAAEDNERLTEAIDELALGARDQDARRMQEALDAVQDVKAGSQDASAQCRRLAGQEDGSAEAATEDAAPEPSPEPTTTSPGDEPSRSPAAPTPTATP